MSVPIITLVKNRIEVILNAIPDIQQVMMSPTDPPDRDNVVFPFASAYLEADDYENRNRLEVNSYALIIGTWFESTTKDKEDLDTLADYYDATIHKAMYADTGLPNLISKLTRQPPLKNFADDELGLMMSRYTVVFLTKYGDPFTQEGY